MEYEFMEPPFNYTSFRELTPKLAKSYFDWYMEQKAARIKQLEECFKYISKTENNLDYSVDSLIELWEWFETQIEFEEKSKEEIEKEYSKIPSHMVDSIEISKNRMTLLTLSLCRDVSIYYGEVITRNMKDIHWGYVTKPKSLADVNRPVLLGFKNNLDLNPTRICHVLAGKSSKEKCSSRLYDNYYIWEKKLL